MVNDPIGDLLTRIRNGQERKKKEVKVLNSKMARDVLTILAKEKFILGFDVLNDQEISVQIKYVNGRPAIESLRRISKPGLRQYVGYRDIKPVMGGIGIHILSTPKGIMTSKEAKKQKVGGELLCEIW